MSQMNLSAITYPCVLKLARTIADLAGRRSNPRIWQRRYNIA
jgi:predicted ATPase with chaperone activity